MSNDVENKLYDVFIFKHSRNTISIKINLYLDTLGTHISVDSKLYIEYILSMSQINVKEKM